MASGRSSSSVPMRRASCIAGAPSASGRPRATPGLPSGRSILDSSGDARPPGCGSALPGLSRAPPTAVSRIRSDDGPPSRARRMGPTVPSASPGWSEPPPDRSRRDASRPRALEPDRRRDSHRRHQHRCTGRGPQRRPADVDPRVSDCCPHLRRLPRPTGVRRGRSAPELRPGGCPTLLTARAPIGR